MIGPGGLHSSVVSAAAKMNSLIKLVIGVRPVPLAKTHASYQYSPLQQVFVRGGKVRWGADAPVTSLDRYAMSLGAGRTTLLCSNQKRGETRLSESRGKQTRGGKKGREEERTVSLSNLSTGTLYDVVCQQ